MTFTLTDGGSFNIKSVTYLINWLVLFVSLFHLTFSVNVTMIGQMYTYLSKTTSTPKLTGHINYKAKHKIKMRSPRLADDV